MTATEIKNDTLSISFERPWTLTDYELFKRSKALPEMKMDYRWQNDSYTLSAPSRFAGVLGMEVPRSTGRELDISEFLFDYQKWIVEMALRSKRFAVWSDCGTGKTPMQLEWSRHVMSRTGGKVLILAPLAVCHQTVEEAKRFYPNQPEMWPEFLSSRDELIRFCKGELKYQTPDSDIAMQTKSMSFAITNYEKFIPGIISELKWLAGLVCDESSVLKSGGGKIKWNLIKSARGIEYKLSCTATPAPNDVMEYASQASFLEKLRSEGEILWTFFNRDQKTQKWTIKPHAREAFYRFMAAWSIYLRKPGAYGFADPFADVPEPEIIELQIECTQEQAQHAHSYLKTYDPTALIPQDRLGVRERSKLSQIAKGFIYRRETRQDPLEIPSRKPAAVAALVRDALAENRQVLVWTVFDEESRLIEKELAEAAGLPLSSFGCLQFDSLHGEDKDSERITKLDAFRAGKIRCLISKAQLLGYGLNFQFCTRMIFSGFDDSFERFYQAVRRCYRYGSKEQLKVYVPYIPTLENHVWENILRKKGQWETDTAEQEKRYMEALKGL